MKNLILWDILEYFILESLTAIEFNYRTGTGSNGSCAFAQNGKMFIVGGDYSTSHSRQIAIVEECALRRVGTLPHVFPYGACNNYINHHGNQQSLLCFDVFVRDRCIRYDNI